MRRWQRWSIYCAATLLCALLPYHAALAWEVTVAVLGDSLTSGYHLSDEEAFGPRLEKALRDEGHTVRIIIHSIPGSTVSDGLRRLLPLLELTPDIAIVALGANDVLHSVPPEVTRRDLALILDALRAKGIHILLAGVEMPFLPGVPSASGLEDMLETLADDYDAVYYPSLLEGVAGKPQFNLTDGLHPNGAGVEVMVRGIAPLVEDIVEEME